MLSGIATSTLRYLSQNPTQSMLAREFAGDVLPHILINRSSNERIDTAVIQLTNISLPFISGYGLNYFFNKVQKFITPLKTPLAKQWFHLGKAASIFAFIASVPIANSFIRNYVTAKRTGSDKFIEVVGEKTLHQKSNKALQQKLNEYLQSIGKILATGALASTLVFGLTQLAIRKKIPFKSVAKFFQKHVGLKNGKFESFGKSLPSSILFWGLPIYVGLFSALRDKFELKETVLRFGAFLVSFFFGPRLIKNATLKWTPKILSRALKGKQNAATLMEFAATTVLCSSLPPLINIFLTHKRVLKEKQQKAAAQAVKQSSQRQPTKHPKPVPIYLPRPQTNYFYNRSRYYLPTYYVPRPQYSWLSSIPYPQNGYFSPNGY